MTSWSDSVRLWPGIEDLADNPGHVAGIALLVFCLVVATRQTAIGYSRNWRLSSAIFLVLFLGVTAFDRFVPTGDVLKGVGWGKIAWERSEVKFIVFLLASVLLAGILALWMRSIMGLVQAIAGASLVALLIAFAPSRAQMWLGVSAGIVGGVWLHWQRDHRGKRRTADDAQAATTDTQAIEIGGLHGRADLQGHCDDDSPHGGA